MTRPPNDGEEMTKSLGRSKESRHVNRESKTVGPWIAEPRPDGSDHETLISAAIALGSCVGLAAPASADPNPANAGPNPYSTLSCNCRESAPPDSPAVREEIHRGNQEGLSAWLPGLPQPTQPRQPRP